VLHWTIEGYRDIASFDSHEMELLKKEIMTLYDSDFDGKLNLAEFALLYDYVLVKRKERRNTLYRLLQ
jgi:hypothetical protein